MGVQIRGLYNISFPLISLTAVAQIRETIEEVSILILRTVGQTRITRVSHHLTPPQTHFYWQKSQKNRNYGEITTLSNALSATISLQINF